MRLILLFASLAALSIGPAQAEGDAKAGAKKADTCRGCHAIPNYTNTYPTYRVPKVGGQSAAYIADALKGYRAGDRPHPTMQANAADLSDQDINDIAAYFASVP